MPMIEDELRQVFEERSAFADQPLRPEDVHVRVRRTRRRRAGATAGVAALAVAATLGGVLAAGDPQGQPSAAHDGNPQGAGSHKAMTLGDLETVGYQVKTSPDSGGPISITLKQRFDSQKLISDLKAAGVNAVPMKEGCPDPGEAVSNAAAAKAWTWVGNDPSLNEGKASRDGVVNRLWPNRVDNGYTMLVGAWSQSDVQGGESTMRVTAHRTGTEAPTCLPLAEVDKGPEIR